MLNLTLRVIASTALSLTVFACVVATPPPAEPPAPAAQLPPGPPPAPAPVVNAPEPPRQPAYPQERRSERVPVSRPAPPAPPPPPIAQAPERPSERVPVGRPAPPAPPSPPALPVPPPLAQAPERPNERVPVRRRQRLGKIANLSIEPTAGPVGTTVTVYGDFRRVRNPKQVRVSFSGVRREAQPVYVARDRIAVRVPRGARSGAVRVRVGRRQAWAGRFAVTPRDNGIFLPTPVDEGLLGAIYRLPRNTRQLPNFDTLGEPFATIVVPSLAVAPRRFDQGFPGLQEAGAPLLEWFAIRFVGMISVPAGERYDFRINSDDGARLYIDGKLVIDNDGQHPPRTRDGSIRLEAGSHDIVVEYFQGPRFEIALELSWRRGNQRWELVPPNAFARYVADNDCNEVPQIFCCAGNAPECRACRRKARRVEDRWRSRCQATPPQTPAPAPGGPSVDCSQPPQKFCCQGNNARCRRCRQEARRERQAWNQQCGGATPAPPSIPAPGGPSVDCSQPPQRFCCQAQTARCQSCQQQAKAERAVWNQQCSSTPPPITEPAPINCKRPPQRACCRARTAQCQSCQRQAAAERASWEQRCSSASPTPPSVPSPGAPKVDCSQPPQRFCCQAQTPSCQSCRQQAASERAVWNQQCSSTPPSQPSPGGPVVDCSQPPQIQPCCKALTPRCRACAREAQAKRNAWQSQCGGK